MHDEEDARKQQNLYLHLRQNVSNMDSDGYLLPIIGHDETYDSENMNDHDYQKIPWASESGNSCCTGRRHHRLRLLLIRMQTMDIYV